MELRIRSMATKETIRVTTSKADTLLDLKTLVALSLADSSPYPVPILPVAIHLSLNQTDELVAPNDGDTLSTLSLASGDVLYYSYHPFPQTLVPNFIPLVSNSGASSSNPIGNSDEGATVNPQPINRSSQPVEIDANPAVSNKSENNNLIRRFLVDLMDNQEDASIFGRVVMLAHAAMLDTDFTLVNESGSNLPQGWASEVSSLRLMYTIPDFVNRVQGIDEKVAVLKLSVLGSMVTVYGHMGGVKSEFYRLCFDLANVATLFSLDFTSLSKSEQEVFMKIFREVKDGISLPLMIDLRRKNCLPLPPCFRIIPNDMKFKILDLLPGTDAVRLGSTCKEMRNLSLDENLWRQKVEREYKSRYMKLKSLDLLPGAEAVRLGSISKEMRTIQEEFRSILYDSKVMSTTFSWREQYKSTCIVKKSTSFVKKSTSVVKNSTHFVKQSPSNLKFKPRRT